MELYIVKKEEKGKIVPPPPPRLVNEEHFCAHFKAENIFSLWVKLKENTHVFKCPTHKGRLPKRNGTFSGALR